MEQRLVTIKKFANSMEANIVKLKLESEGIKCFLKNDNMIPNIGLHWVELVINEIDRERVIEVFVNLNLGEE